MTEAAVAVAVEGCLRGKKRVGAGEDLMKEAKVVWLALLCFAWSWDKPK